MSQPEELEKEMARLFIMQATESRSSVLQGIRNRIHELGADPNDPDWFEKMKACGFGGMSQERTEQRAVTLEELQREMKGKIGFGPNAERTRILIEGFKKWPENFERWVDEGNYYGWDVDSFIRLIWEKDGEVDRLNAVIAGQAEAIREQTAKVQERDKYIESLTARYIALGADLDKRDKETERLRGAGEHIIYEAVRMSENDWDEPSIAFGEKSVEWRAALKGAE